MISATIEAKPELGLAGKRADRMQKLIVAFDVDGTLVSEDDIPQITMIHMLQILAKQTKNVRIIVWSGGGKEYAEMWCRRLKIEEYVWKCMPKTADYPVDIAFDDQQAFALADKNVIVRLK